MTNTSDYFLPFSRQPVYSAMQPLSIEFSVSNRKSGLSRIPLLPQYSVFAKNQKLVENDCIQLEFSYEENFWPFFGLIQTLVHAPDNPACRNISAEAVEIAVRLPVQSLEDFSSPDGSNPTLTEFKIIVDFIETPSRISGRAGSLY